MQIKSDLELINVCQDKISSLANILKKRIVFKDARDKRKTKGSKSLLLTENNRCDTPSCFSLDRKICDLTKMCFNRRIQPQARIREEQCLVNMR